MEFYPHMLMLQLITIYLHTKELCSFIQFENWSNDSILLGHLVTTRSILPFTWLTPAHNFKPLVLVVPEIFPGGGGVKFLNWSHYLTTLTRGYLVILKLTASYDDQCKKNLTTLAAVIPEMSFGPQQFLMGYVTLTTPFMDDL